MKNNLKIKGILAGILGSFVGAIPNMFLKYFLVIWIVSTLGWRWVTDDLFQLPLLWDTLIITPVGCVSIIGFGGSLLTSLFLIMSGGALFGLLGMYISFINSRESSYIEIKDWKGSYWLSFWAGMLYNLVFIFYVPVFAS